VSFPASKTFFYKKYSKQENIPFQILAENFQKIFVCPLYYLHVQ
jgi:hypothetical protein